MTELSKNPTKPNTNGFNYPTKSTIAQNTALLSSYLFNMKIGIDTMAPGIIIGAAFEKNFDEAIHLPDLSDDQKSWIGSLIYLVPPAGSLVVTIVQDRFGHRTCMVLSNIVQVVTLIILLLTSSTNALYLVSALLGFNMGLVTGFSVPYSGEICDPKLRGTLTSVMNLFYFIGYLYVTSMYALTKDWKMSILSTAAVPLVTAIATFVVTPESPMWMLSKGRTEEAKETLKTIRGGVSDEQCAIEFQEMVLYVNEMNSNNLQTGETQKACNFFTKSFDSFIQPEMLKPLQLMIIFIFFSNLLSGVSFTPYLIHVFDRFNVPIDSAWVMTMYTAFCIVGNFLTILLVNRFGKRFLSLYTIITCSFCHLFIGIIGTFWQTSLASSWAILMLFFTSSLLSSMGIQPLVWTLMCEIFPMKCKTVGASISSVTYFVLCFLMTNFYLKLEAIIHFYNIFILFGITGLIGFVYLYFQLPETENKTLNEISQYFKSKYSMKIQKHSC